MNRIRCCRIAWWILFLMGSFLLSFINLIAVILWFWANTILIANDWIKRALDKSRFFRFRLQRRSRGSSCRWNLALKQGNLLRSKEVLILMSILRWIENSWLMKFSLWIHEGTNLACILISFSNMYFDRWCQVVA